MATKIPVGTSAYFTAFATGQGAGAANYFTYAEDEDTNYLLLRQTINQMIDEISAVSGPNATVALDLVVWDDVDNPISAAEQPYGVVGAASYEVSVEGGGTLKIKKGQAFVNRQKVTLIADMTGVTSSGGAGTRWVAIDVNGAVYIESSAAQRALDIASVTWNGTIFTGTPTHLADVFFDGDSWAEIRDRAVTPDVATLGAYTFRRGANRVRALELLLAGQDTGPEGEAIAGPIALLPGGVGTPAIILGDGSTTFDTTTGWYRPSADQWGWAGEGNLVLSLRPTGLVFHNLGTPSSPRLKHTSGAGIYFPANNELGIACESDLVMRFKSPTNQPQALIADGVVGAPSLALDQDEDTGFYSPAVAELALAIAGVKRFHWAAGYLRIPDGVVGAPALAFESDPDTGMYTPGVGRLGLATAGAKALELDAVGNCDLPLNMGAIVRRVAAQTAIASGTPTQVSWDTEDRDIGGWIAVTATDLVVPTDGDGLYLITFEWTWDNIGAPFAGDRGGWIEAAGTIYALKALAAWKDKEHPDAVSTIVPLVATDVVRGIVLQSNATPLDLVKARLAIQKIA